MPSFDQNTHLQDLKAFIPGRIISEISAAFDLDPAHIIKLGSNENPWGISPKALTEISKLDQSFNQKLSFYPDALSQMLTEELKKKFPEIGNAAIIAGNGMDNILEATARLLLSPGDKTIIHTPTFEYYEIVTKWAYAEPVFIETKAENNFKLNIEELLNQIDSKTKLIFLCNPNNPTGNSFEWAEIKEILQ
ncbi:MAG: aminotransferase class I/II-fold pyridoxal phosphate-dependent enzyme, partial [Candidatus Melainabacteria bacterium]